MSNDGRIPVVQVYGLTEAIEAAVTAATAGLGRWEVLMVDGLPLSTPDGSDWIYVKVDS